MRKQTGESEDERWEKEAGKEAKKVEKRESYARFINRGGPKAPGSKLVPLGSPGCLNGLVFVLTGVYESLQRDEVSALVKKLGARVVTSVSKNVTHMVVGEQAGPSKLQKAALLRTKLISEDELLDLIREKSGEENTNLDTRSNTNMDNILDKNLDTILEKNLNVRLNLEEGEDEVWEERENRQLVNFISREARQLGLEVKICLLLLMFIPIISAI